MKPPKVPKSGSSSKSKVGDLLATAAKSNEAVATATATALAAANAKAAAELQAAQAATMLAHNTAMEDMKQKMEQQAAQMAKQAADQEVAHKAALAKAVADLQTKPDSGEETTRLMKKKAKKRKRDQEKEQHLQAIKDAVAAERASAIAAAALTQTRTERANREMQQRLYDEKDSRIQDGHAQSGLHHQALLCSLFASKSDPKNLQGAAELLRTTNAHALGNQTGTQGAQGLLKLSPEKARQVEGQEDGS